MWGCRWIGDGLGAAQTFVPAGTFRSPTTLVANGDALYVADGEVVWTIAGSGAPQVLVGERDMLGVRLGSAPGSLWQASRLAVQRNGTVHLMSGDALITVAPR